MRQNPKNVARQSNRFHYCRKFTKRTKRLNVLFVKQNCKIVIKCGNEVREFVLWFISTIIDHAQRGIMAQIYITELLTLSETFCKPHFYEHWHCGRLPQSNLEAEVEVIPSILSAFL